MNVLEYAAAQERWFENRLSENGFERNTTFWSDYSIADCYGVDAIQDTFNRTYEEWKDNVVFMSEMVVVLNWKIWEWYEKGDQEKSKLYDTLWKQARDYCLDNYKGKDFEYYFNFTD